MKKRKSAIGSLVLTLVFFSVECRAKATDVVKVSYVDCQTPTKETKICFGTSDDLRNNPVIETYELEITADLRSCSKQECKPTLPFKQTIRFPLRNCTDHLCADVLIQHSTDKQVTEFMIGLNKYKDKLKLSSTVISEEKKDWRIWIQPTRERAQGTLSFRRFEDFESFFLMGSDKPRDLFTFWLVVEPKK